LPFATNEESSKTIQVVRKVALVFAVAVIAPSLVLAWLAVRSLQDQQFLLEKQESLLYQGVADAKAKEIVDAIGEYQRGFSTEVGNLMRTAKPNEITRTFDERLRQSWPLAQVGFVVTLMGELLCPSPFASTNARLFCADNSRFLANRESVEVYWNPKQGYNYSSQPPGSKEANQNDIASVENDKRFILKNSVRNVSPQQQPIPYQQKMVSEEQQISKIAPSETEFRQLIGESSEGTLARFVDNKLNLMLWHRPPDNPRLVFGAQISLPKLVEKLRGFIEQLEPPFNEQVCVALLDDNAHPIALSKPGFVANWKRPFIASEIGEALPHWEIAVYLLNPAKLTESARTFKFTISLLVAVLLLAIGIGSWLIVVDLGRQLRLARQKTDFVSNVSHELKTPLTSIRMFSELLAEGRVSDAGKQRSYLGIITSETARLTRLINNVLDFSRIERGEKKYNFAPTEVTSLVRETAETYRPNLETNGFKFECHIPEEHVTVSGDRDALAQVLVNLLSNAEKYSDSKKEICLQVESRSSPVAHVEIKVMDRGLGVPSGCGDKIFEQFYRAHDGLSSGIQGCGLGLTLARQIARAHGGDVTYESREGGGSCFTLRLPIKPERA
jgi:signal transduction histidine kinase